MRTFLHRPHSVFLRRALFQVHMWLGLIAGLYVLVVSVSGAALVFRIDMQRAMHPDLFTPTGGPLAEPAAVMESVRRAFPDGRVSGVDAPTTVRPTYLAYVVRGDSFLTILVDPASTRVLGELPEDSLVRAVQELHFDLLGGRSGRVANGIGAAALLLLCLTGLVIWWPGLANWPRGLTLDFSRSWRRINWDLHSAVGFWAAALVALWAVTGVYFAFPSQFRAAVNALSPVTVTRAPSSDAAAPRPAVPPTWRALIERARATVPAHHVARVVVAGNERDAFLVMFSDTAPTPAAGANLQSVYLDQFSGAVLDGPPAQRRSAGDVVMAWMAPLHVGNFGGTGVRVAWLVLGLAPALLFMTGFTMWWTRVVRTRWMRLRVGTAEDTSSASKTR